MNFLITSVIIMLLGSAFFSATEAALFSTPINKAKILSNQKRNGAEYLLKIKKNMHPTITVLVVFNNIFNIAGSIFVGSIATEVFGSAKIGIFSAVLTFFVIVFAEIIPKGIGESFAVPISLSISKPLFYTTKFFSPLIKLIEFFTKRLPQNKKTISEEEIRTLSNIGFLEGVIEEDEKEMIHRVFLLNDLSAKEVMTPRTIITAFDGRKKLKELEKELYSLSHSRIPVYEENLDNIIGICHQRELLIAFSRGEKEKEIKEFANRKVIKVNESQKIDELIPIFQKERCHLALVVDDFGGTAGIITLEDVLEQIIGDVVDETDETENMREKAKRKSKK
jgi:CBS domain containing-hemolysin-like protein